MAITNCASTHHFDFDWFRFAPDEHAHTMIDGLVSCPIVGQHESEVNSSIASIDAVVPVRIGLVLDPSGSTRWPLEL